MSDGPAHQQTLLLLDILSHTQLSRQLINQREDHQRAVLIQLLLGTYDINLAGRSLRLGCILLAGSTTRLLSLSLSQVHIELFHLLVKRLHTVQILHVREVRKLIHRQIGSLHLSVLYASTIFALVIVLILRFILNDDRGKLIRIHLRALTHLLPGLRAPSRLNAQVLVHLRLEDTEFIHLGLCRHTQPSVTAGTIGKTRPEVRKLCDNRRIITDSRLQITRLVMQERTVENSHEVLWFHLDDKVEVEDGTVVITQLHTHQTPVVMSQEVVRIQIERIIVIAHSST